MVSKKNNNLTIIIGSLEVGGAETQLVSVLPCLKQRGFCIRVLVLGPPGKLSSSLIQEGISVISLCSERREHLFSKMGQLGRLFRTSYMMLHLMKKLHCSSGIVHCFLPEAVLMGFIGALLVRFKGPLLFSRRSLNQYQKRRPFLARIEKLILPYATQAIANSRAVLQQLQEEGHSEAVMIYNGVASHRILHRKEGTRNSIRQKLQIPEEAIVLIKVANLHFYKGHAQLLHALSALPSSVYLLCPGRDAGAEASLKDLSKQLGLTDRVRWLGHREDISDLFMASDISVLCSYEEGFSNAILESMASGLPVVATDVGGNKEAVVHGETGYIVSGAEDLLTSLKTLVSCKTQRHLLGEAGRKRILETFSLEAAAEAHSALYQKVLKL